MEAYTIAEAAAKWIAMIETAAATPEAKAALVAQVRAACPGAEALKAGVGNVALGSTGRSVFTECCNRIKREMAKGSK